MATNTKSKPLIGQELLDKVTSMEKADRKEKARACGYVTKTKNGQERVNLMQFTNALIQAVGVDLDANDESGSRGRTPTYKVSVHKNGNLLIGAAYTKKMNLQPGDEFEIKLGNHNIKLERVDD
ncbi:MAG: AbrB family transcriptional regulator [Cyanobacteriota bacterium]|nr:AbrB family transcriptional regulator [Cyanobacteriota bacterium]